MIAVRVKVGALALLFVAGCPRPLTPAEQEIGDVALVAERQACISTLQISRRGYPHANLLDDPVRGPVIHTHYSWYDINACGVSVELYARCGDHGGTMECGLDIAQSHERLSRPPRRSRLVAEVISVVDHARTSFPCSLVEVPMRIERRASGPDAAYEVGACGIKHTFEVVCPHQGSIDPDDCRVSDR